MPYRLIYIGLGLIGVAAIALGIVFATEGEQVVLPGALEDVSPSPGSLVPPQASIEVDLEVGYSAMIFVDGFPINNATFVEPTGVYRWSPTPADPVITAWTPGDHTIRVVWDTYTGLPDPGSFEWSFRVG